MVTFVFWKWCEPRVSLLLKSLNWFLSDWLADPGVLEGVGECRYGHQVRSGQEKAFIGSG